MISGKPAKGVSLDQAKEAIQDELKRLSDECIERIELEKVKNKFEATLVYTNMSYLNKAMGLANFENLGDAFQINTQVDRYRSITAEHIRETARKLFTPENSSILYYRAKK
ncbi:MAG: insulinase family protein, partial [Bacteroidota bacterium]|nr:insulinase family protein [Bacteroidota bacterium]